MTENRVANYRGQERIIKGFANHRRLQIMDLLKKEPGLSVEEISIKLDTSYENASDHLRKLAVAGLITKRNESTVVRHKLTERGVTILLFCKKLQ